MKKIFFTFLFCSGLLAAQDNSAAVWNPDNSDGTYSNPVIHADYSDPDVIRVGDEYFMVSSSFAQTPGLPLLHSKDLIHWRIVNHIVKNIPYGNFEKPQHGSGIWAPAIRYHKGEYYVYYGDADFGIFMTKTRDPFGKWEPLTLVREARGWIDPCPLWDDDGQAYLVHAFAKSRAGYNSRLAVHKMSADGRKLLDEGTIVFADTAKHPTIEGPKFYKRKGYYYVFAPAGGVLRGWQTILRSRSVFGPYEDKIVLEQGPSSINGPHQGGWVTSSDGSDWFLHFQDKDAYGRIVHLQPMKWQDNWPSMGADTDSNGIGEPVLKYKKPSEAKGNSFLVPQTGDEFSTSRLGLQWQWEANHKNEWFSLKERKGYLRLFSQNSDAINIYNLPNVIGQKFPAQEFTAEAKMEFNPAAHEERAGVVVLGMDYAAVYLKKEGTGFKIYQVQCINAHSGGIEESLDERPLDSGVVFLRIKTDNKGICAFTYSQDGTNFSSIGKSFKARKGRWVGARIGLFAQAAGKARKKGFADFDHLRFSK